MSEKTSDPKEPIYDLEHLTAQQEAETASAASNDALPSTIEEINVFAGFSPIQNNTNLALVPQPIKVAVGQQFELIVADHQFLLRLTEPDTSIVDDRKPLNLEIKYPDGKTLVYRNVITPNSPKITVGRREENTFQVPQVEEYGTISGKHFSISFDYASQKILLSDEGATNPTIYVGRTHSPDDKQSRFEHLGEEVTIKNVPISDTPRTHIFHLDGINLKITTYQAAFCPEDCPIKVFMQDPRTGATSQTELKGKSQYSIGILNFDDVSLVGANLQAEHVRLTITSTGELIVHKLAEWGELFYHSSKPVSYQKYTKNPLAQVIKFPSK